MKILSRLITCFNRFDSRILVFAIISIFFLGFRLIYNEEQYFGYARAYMDPGWIKDSFIFTDFPGTRIIFQYLSGWILRLISFEQLAFFGRMFNFLLYAFPVAAFARHLKLNNILLAFWLAVIFIPQQSFFAGEWLFGGFEPKTLAYVFVLWSLVFLFREQYFICILFAAFSTCLHLLVGGWYSLYLFIFIVLKHKMKIKIVLDWIIYCIILAPLAIYLYTGIFSGNETVINGVNTDEVYVFIRNPYHIGLFKSQEYFLHYHAGKIAICLVAFLLSLSLYRKSAYGNLRALNTLLIIILAQNLLFVIIAFFDRNGILLKYYPFRGNLIAMMVFQLETLILLKEKWIPGLYVWLKKKKIRWTRRIFYQVQMVLLLCLFLLTVSFKIADRYSNYRSGKEYWREINDLSEHLKQNSNVSDRFILLCPENQYTRAIPRKAERDAFFYFQFIPTEPAKIYTWYTHMLIQENIRANPVLLLQPDIRNEVSFIVSCSVIINEHFQPVYQSGHYYLYKIDSAL